MEIAAKKPLARWWLITGIIGLAVAGLYALPLAFMRSPAVKNSEELTRLFRDLLVVHVDLSVLIWFLAMACLLWSLLLKNTRTPIPYIEESALISFGLGALAITLSPLDPAAIPLMVNYIPVVYSPIFFLGLGLVFCGVLLMLAKFCLTYKQSTECTPSLRFGLLSAALITAVSAGAFVYSVSLLPMGLEETYHYELAFWAGGHVLQFTHTQMLMVAWIMIAAVISSSSISTRYLIPLFAIGLIAALLAPLGYRHSIDSFEHQDFYTQLMMYGGGIAPSVLGLWIVAVLWETRMQRKGDNKALWSALLMSVVLFFYGGFLGVLIQGQNVVIPAHYHGSIVGITLAFMGLAYLLMPQLGYHPVSAWRSAYWQPIIYGLGQIIHISGLAYSGGYGVIRKMPGGMENAPMDVKAAMGLMGLGGLLAIIGGLMFVVVMYRSIRRANH